MQLKPDEILCPDGDASNLVAQAPLPTRGTLFMRKFIPFQLFRFVLANLRTVIMVTKGHDWKA